MDAGQRLTGTAAGGDAGQTHVFRSPPLLLTGWGCSAEVGRLVAGLGVRRALVVVDPNVRAAGADRAVLDACAGSGVAVAVYDGVTSEPVLEYVAAALDLLRTERCDGVVAVGGGSVIDTAKAAAAWPPTAAGSRTTRGSTASTPRPCPWWRCRRRRAPGAKRRASPWSPTGSATSR